MSDHIKTVTDTSFEQDVMNASKPVLVDVFDGTVVFRNE